MVLVMVVSKLTRENRYQSNAGRRKCILFLILIIVGLVIVLIYKPRSHSDSPPPPTTGGENGIVLDPLPDIPPRPGLEEGSEVTGGWQGESDPIGDDDLRRRRHRGR